MVGFVLFFCGIGRGWGAAGYNALVRPILQEYCFQCHGPDSAARKAGLRLDDPEWSYRAGKSGRKAIDPGNPGGSELIRRVETEDREERMPPVEGGKSLTVEQRAVLREWVAGGARYERHWAFLPPQITALPEKARKGLEGDSTSSGSLLVDGWVWAGLAQQGLRFAPEENRAGLLRRLALDLTGLPPEREEVRAFETDPSPDAYEKRLDALLASKRMGEHWASWWLDIARYADSSGFQGDPYRSMWRWRDYVVESFNDNKPFDRFTVEQMAGDLLPNATVEERLATGFHRNHRFNTEFGSIEAEWKVENGVDRVETTAAAWLGLTMGCARCHDHKYDPISQREFYGMFALLTHGTDRGVFWDGYDAVFEPSMRAPRVWESSELRKLNREVEEAERRWRGVRDDESEQRERRGWVRENGRQWRQEVREFLSVEQGEGMGWEAMERQQARWRLLSAPTQMVVHLPLDGSWAARTGQRREWVTNQTVVTNRMADGQDRFETNRRVEWVKTDFGKTVKVGVLREGGSENAVSMRRYAEGLFGGAWIAEPELPALRLERVMDREKGSLSFWMKSRGSNGVILSKMSQQALFPLGFQLLQTNGHFRLEIYHKQFEFDSTMVPYVAEVDEGIPVGEWLHVVLVLDGRRRDRGPGLYCDGRRMRLEPKQATARGFNSVTNGAPLLVGQGWSGMVDEMRWYDRVLRDEEVEWLHGLRWGKELMETDPEPGVQAVDFYHRFLSATGHWYRDEWLRVMSKRDAFEKGLPQVMVMDERTGVPTARVLSRGQYDQPREEVVGGLPAILGAWPAGEPTNRLGLARWMVSRSNPLTARVVMNRVWERLMGQGLVKTSENLGVQAALPSHPELLDGLAVEWMNRGWDFKSMLKTLVMSRTYRQSSKVTEWSLEHDPENRWLGRGARFRLSAEVIRDQALWAGGLLDERRGGPSVESYLPGGPMPGGSDRYRRSLYGVWQRTRFNPSMALFDAPSRESCQVKRPRTNTPLQALALWNEVTYVEAARKLAERMLDAGMTTEIRVGAGMERVLGRKATVEELGHLSRLFERQMSFFVADEEAASRLVDVGGSWSDVRYGRVELAAMAMVASAILNLDETLTRE